MLDTGNGIVEIFNDGDDAPGKGVIRHFAFATDDVDACIEIDTYKYSSIIKS